MARSLTIRSVERRADRAYIRFGKNEIEVPAANLQELREWIRSRLDESDETLVALALACWLARDNNLATPATIVGKTITLNLQGSLTATNAVFRVT